MTTNESDYSMLENVAAISGDFHTHARYREFMDKFGPDLGGFTGSYSLCIQMARALTFYENASGVGHEVYEQNGSSWIEIVERFVDAMIQTSIEKSQQQLAFDVLDSVLPPKITNLPKLTP